MDDRMPTVGRDDDGNMIIMTDDGLAATFLQGEWQPGLKFSTRTIDGMEHVSDPQEVQQILEQASEALQQFAAKHQHE